MSENVSPQNPKPLSAKQRRAAELLAHDELTDSEIASELGINERTLYRWKKCPAFAAAMSEAAEGLADVSRRYALGKRARRVQALTARWEKMLKVIEARGADSEHAKAAGGDTGLLVRVLKGIGKGEQFQVVEEFSFDAALVRELREHEKQAAQELGQLIDKHELTGKDGGPMQSETRMTYEELRKLPADELLRLHRQEIGAP